MRHRVKIYLSILIISFSFLNVEAQKEAWHWYFGANAGIDFSSGVAVVVSNGALNTYEGVASISDSSGNLLFYTDGQRVYDATHNQMPNGFGLAGNQSATQSAVIVKKPGSSNLFYVFTVDYNHDGLAVGTGFNYSIVDMNLNSSLGDVSVKNIFVRGHVYEKLTAAKHGNNIDYWILINDWFADDIYAYLLDSSGFNITPVASNAGPFHNQDAGMSPGYFKANRQGNKLALAMWQKASYDVLDFDNLTGIASNHILIQSPDMNWTYGVEFSPDGTKLYGTEMDPPAKLFQFDLMAGSPAAILSSRVTLATNNILYYYCALQIAPDAKIYCAHRLINFIGVIAQPDSAGISCNYIDNGVNFSGMQSTLGLPNFIPDYVLPVSNVPSIALQSSDTNFCEKLCIDFYDLSTNNPTSWQWFFPGADSTTSILQNPTNICYNNYGSFDVTLIACNAAGCDTLVLTGFINEYQTLTPTITQSNDTLFSSPGVSYQWWNVSTGIIAGATNSYYLPTTGGDYYVIVTDTIGCAGSSNVITVSFAVINQLAIGNSQLAINPNPFHSKITISIKSPKQNIKQATFEIKNLLGQLVFIKEEKNLTSHYNKTLDLSFLENGIYFLELIVNGERVVKKIVKQ